MKIWVLSTCIPEECKPCYPNVFASDAAALAAFREAMRAEWQYNGEYDDEGKLLPCPEDPWVANDKMAELSGGDGGWGEYLLTCHEVGI